MNSCAILRRTGLCRMHQVLTNFPIDSEGPSEGMTEENAADPIQQVSKRLDSQFRSLFEAAPDAILIVDGTGRIILVNEQTEQLFGYHRLELHGQLIELLVPERF